MSRKVAMLLGLLAMSATACLEDNPPDSTIIAVMDADPVVINRGSDASIRYIVKEPVAAGYTLGQVMTARIDSQYASIGAGTLVELGCYDRNWGQYCSVKILATPTPPTPR
jgi:hypothetical protein